MTYDDGLARLIQGDALDVLAEMPERSVDCVVTSPPYWGLRAYQGEQERVWGNQECLHEWGDSLPAHHPGQVKQTKWEQADAVEQGQNAPSGQFCQCCGAWRGNFGNEPSVALYIAHLMEFMRAIKRVLKDTGVAWVNLGDSMDALNLAGVPQRFFTACQDDGWIVRSEIPLVKDSPMPESLRGWFWARCRVKVPPRGEGRSVREQALGIQDRNGGVATEPAQWADCPGCEKCAPGGLVLRKGSWRPTSSHEKLFMLTKGDGYFSDGEDVRLESGANLRDVWPMKSSAFTMQLCKACKRVYTGAQFGRLHGEPKKCSCGASDWLSHFAAFHPSLPTICILASTSPGGNCSKCGMPWVRVVEKGPLVEHPERQGRKDRNKADFDGDDYAVRDSTLGLVAQTKTLDFKPSCQCGAEPEPALVLDPFNGTASTGIAAKRLGRRYIGIDLSEDYLLLSAARLAAETAGMM